jgi:aryl-alcohol dehydrogenase-like predicted oxidoreductase
VDERPYGETGFSVSALAYGAMSIGADPDLGNGVAPSLLCALESGVTLIDTARVYPNSEAIIASTLREWRGARPLISTKVRALSRETYRAYRPLAEAYTAQSIRDSVEQSLSALGVDCLDIVHLHQWHYLWTHDPIWLESLQALKREGKLRAIAISVQDHEHDAALEAVSTRLVDGVQVIFNLFESRPANALLPLAEARGVGVIARCVLDSGGLSGELSRSDFAARPFLKHAPYTEYIARTEEFERFTPGSAADLAELALRFAITPAAISAATVGMPSRSLVEETLAAIGKGPLASDIEMSIRRDHVWTKNFYERLP